MCGFQQIRRIAITRSEHENTRETQQGGAEGSRWGCVKGSRVTGGTGLTTGTRDGLRWWSTFLTKHRPSLHSTTITFTVDISLVSWDSDVNK